jgi:hypothetical protein
LSFLTVRPGFLFEKHLRHALRSHLFARQRLVRALHERQLEALAGRHRRATLLSEATPQEISDHVFQLPILLDGAHLHRTDQVIGQIERRLHWTIVLESWFSGLARRSLATIAHQTAQ